MDKLTATIGPLTPTNPLRPKAQRVRLLLGPSASNLLFRYAHCPLATPGRFFAL